MSTRDPQKAQSSRHARMQALAEAHRVAAAADASELRALQRPGTRPQAARAHADAAERFLTVSQSFSSDADTAQTLRALSASHFERAQRLGSVPVGVLAVEPLDCSGNLPVTPDSLAASRVRTYAGADAPRNPGPLVRVPRPNPIPNPNPTAGTPAGSGSPLERLWDTVESFRTRLPASLQPPPLPRWSDPSRRHTVANVPSAPTGDDTAGDLGFSLIAADSASVLQLRPPSDEPAKDQAAIIAALRAENSALSRQVERLSRALQLVASPRTRRDAATSTHDASSPIAAGLAAAASLPRRAARAAPGLVVLGRPCAPARRAAADVPPSDRPQPPSPAPSPASSLDAAPASPPASPSVRPAWVTRQAPLKLLLPPPPPSEPVSPTVSESDSDSDSSEDGRASAGPASPMRQSLRPAGGVLGSPLYAAAALAVGLDFGF